MDVAVASYIRFKTKCGSYINLRNFQNFFVSESRLYQGINYVFAPFYISGNTSTRGGDAMQASLTVVPNALSTSLVSEAVLQGWLVEVKTVLLNFSGTAFSEYSVLTQQVWGCFSANRDSKKLTITLSTPLDAAKAQIPKRVLNTVLVGSIPSTGSIPAR